MAEKYLTYVEDDVPGRLAVSALSVAVSGMRRDEDVSLTKDFGASFFGDVPLGINFDAIVTAHGNNSNMGIFAIKDVLNTVFDNTELQDTALFTRGVASGQLQFVRAGDGATASDIVDIAIATWYYCTYTRSGDTSLLTIYQDFDRTQLFEPDISLSVTRASVQASRYLHAVMSVDSGAVGVMSGGVANLNILTDSDAVGGIGNPVVPIIPDSLFRPRRLA